MQTAQQNFNLKGIESNAKGPAGLQPKVNGIELNAKGPADLIESNQRLRAQQTFNLNGIGSNAKGPAEL